MKKLQLMVLSVLAATLGCVVCAAPALAAPSFDRHYELATPPDKDGQAARLTALAPDGTAVTFDNRNGSGGGFPGTEAAGASGSNGYLTTRRGGVWSYFPMNVSAADIPQGIFRDAAPSLDRQLFAGAINVSAAQSALFVRTPGAPPTRVSAVFTNLRGASSKAWVPAFRGASKDLSHVVVALPPEDGRLLPQDLPRGSLLGGSAEALYESVHVDSPVLRRVDVDEEGEIIGHCGARVGSLLHTSRAVSDDGRRIFFSSQDDRGQFNDCWGPPVDLYARIDGAQTVRLSTSYCNRAADPLANPPVPACAPRTNGVQFQSASADGQRVFFTSGDQLVNGDTDGTSDLYMYDFRAPVNAPLSQLSAGDATDTTPGSGADVQGFLRASEDGSRTYFVARGVLTTAPNSEHASAVDGGNNLYLATASGEIKFVATLAYDSEMMWAYNDVGGLRPVQLADTAGRYLVFASATPLTSDDTDAASDIYRYDAQTEVLERVSVGRDGFGDNGNSDGDGASINGPIADQASLAEVTAQSRQVSGDGSQIVFATTQALEPDDVNGKSDVYEWRDGQVRMVSDGQDATGVGAGGYGFLMSEDGSAVAFSTWRALLPDRDTDTSSDVYVARTGADVDPLPAPVTPCAGDKCQGPLAPPSGPLANAGSSTFAGAGNVVAPVPAPTSVQVAKVKAVHGTSTQITVKVSGEGRIQASGLGLRLAQKTVKKAGTYKMAVKLSQQAQQTLRHKHRVKVSVSVRFTPVRGAEESARVSVTFTPKARRSSSRSARQVSVLSSADRKGR